MSRAAPPFDRTPIRLDRVARIDGSFAAIPHRLLRDGFWAALGHHELLLYFLLALVADRQGMSFYGDDRLAALLRLARDELRAARAGLLRQDLIAYDPLGHRHQVLSLPPRHLPVASREPLPQPRPAAASAVPVPVRELVRNLLARLETAQR